MSLKEKAAGGVKWTAISAVTSTICQLALIAILARFLSKKDFGLMAIATFVIGFSQMFIDMGISNAIIYKKEVTHKQLSSLYWLNIISGCLIFLIMFLLAPYIATFYEEPKLKNVINIVALTFLIQPFGMQFAVLLQKDLDFKSLAIRDVGSKVLTLIVGSLLGYLGFGVFALAISNLVGVAVATFLLLVVGLKMHRPGFYFKYSEIKEFVSFGLFQMGEKIMNYFNSQIDSVIIGKFLGMEVLGTYNIAKNLVMRPPQIINPIITKVSFPVMAKIQHDIVKLKTIYLKTLNLMSSVNFPVFLFMAAFADPIVRLLFGDQWSEAIIVLQILSIYSLIRSTVNPVGSLQLAKGRADLGFYWNLILLLFVPLSIYAGSFWGVKGVCYAFLLLQIILSVPVWRFMIRPLCNATMLEYYQAFGKPGLIALLAVVGGYVVNFIGLKQPLSIFTVGFVVVTILLGMFYYFFDKSFILEIKGMLFKGNAIKE